MADRHRGRPRTSSPRCPWSSAPARRSCKGKDPYPLIKPHQHITAPPGQPAYDVYNPYLPLMSLFGGPRSTDAPPRLTDARVAFSVFTILIVVVAMALCRGPDRPPGAGAAEHDGVAHRRPSPRHRR